MRKFVLILITLLFTFSFTLGSVHAKRFGGGKSFGASRSIGSSAQSSSLSNAARPSLAGNPWLHRLTGLALGGLLAYLLMSNGLASGLLSWLILGGVILFIVHLIRSRMQTATQSHYGNTTNTNPLFNAPARFANKNKEINQAMDFDASAFLQAAKAQFVELQSAYDQKNFAQLREFTTNPVFNEIEQQLQERGDVKNVTEVVTIDAVLLDVVTEQQTAFNASAQTYASVRFSGMIREDIEKSAAAFNEIWHFEQNQKGGRWLVAGIQQN